MIIVQIIYTLDSGEQHLANFPLYPYVLETKRNFITFAKQAFYSYICFVDKTKWGLNNKDEFLLPEDVPTKPIFSKLSCCIITPKGKKKILPSWYDKCDGKLYWKDLNPGKVDTLNY